MAKVLWGRVAVMTGIKANAGCEVMYRDTALEVRLKRDLVPTL